MTRYATIDVGSNSSLLLVVDRSTGGEIEVLADTKISTRLSGGLETDGAISGEAIERQFAALDRFKTILDESQVADVIACGTQIFRAAPNGAELAKKITERFGWKMEIISGEVEAGLSYRAACSGIEKVGENRLVVDVGGGSTEVIFGKGVRIDRGRSFPIGAVNLTEECNLSTVIDDTSRRCATHRIADIFDGLERLGRPAFDAQVVAVGGTATTLAAIHSKILEYKPDKIHGRRLEKSWLDEQVAVWGSLDSHSRRRRMPFDPDRAEIIVGGTMILNHILRLFGFNSLIVSNRGLRWGLLFASFAELDPTKIKQAPSQNRL